MPAKKTNYRNKPVVRRNTKNVSRFYRWRKLGSRVRALLVIGMVAIVGIVATLYTHAQQISDEETVTLSNGKEVRLGQSAQSLEETLGSDLYKLNARQYEYPGKANKPIEVVMDLDNGKVVVIHVVNGTSNFTNSLRGTVGLSFQKLSAEERRAQALSGALAQLRQKGLSVDQSRSVQYFFPDRCHDNGQVHLVSLAQKGFENRIAQDLGGTGCIDED